MKINYSKYFGQIALVRNLKGMNLYNTNSTNNLDLKLTQREKRPNIRVIIYNKKLQ